jgi:hypothetical protein
VADALDALRRQVQVGTEVNTQAPAVNTNAWRDVCKAREACKAARRPGGQASHQGQGKCQSDSKSKCRKERVGERGKHLR